mmetsp:Transcript_1144/g.2380  ORF Transcript_1144/g.2380 Transcript_1144/m.2380 type:complete len:367 (-) Transcript_1144:259-1359(-)
MMFDPLLNRASDAMLDDNDILSLDASFVTCADTDDDRRRRAYTDTVLSAPDRKRKRLEQQRYLSSRRRLMLALASTIHFFGRIVRCLPHLFVLRNPFTLYRRGRSEGGERDHEPLDEMSMDDESSLVHHEHDENEEREDRFVTNPAPKNTAVVAPIQPQLGVYGQKGEPLDNLSLVLPPSLMLEESFRARRPRNQSMKHVRSQSMQQYPSAPVRMHRRSQSLSHICSLSMPPLLEESAKIEDETRDEDTVPCGGQVYIAKYRDSHESRPFAMAPPSPEPLCSRKRRQRQKTFDTGYSNTTNYREGPVRKAMSEFRSIENPSCEEYLEERFRRRSVVLEEIRSKMPKPPQGIFKEDPKLQRSSGFLT